MENSLCDLAVNVGFETFFSFLENVENIKPSSFVWISNNIWWSADNMIASSNPYLKFAVIHESPTFVLYPHVDFSVLRMSASCASAMFMGIGLFDVD